MWCVCSVNNVACVICAALTTCACANAFSQEPAMLFGTNGKQVTENECTVLPALILILIHRDT